MMLWPPATTRVSGLLSNDSACSTLVARSYSTCEGTCMYASFGLPGHCATEVKPSLIRPGPGPCGSAAADVLAPDLRVAPLELPHGGHALLVLEQDDLHAPAGQEAEVACEGLRLADHHPGDLEQQDRPGAHLARGQRGVQGRVGVGGAPAGVAQAGDLAVRHRVAALHPLVVPGRDELPALAGTARGEHRPDRHAAGLQADPRLVQGQRHHLAIAPVRLPVSHAGLRYLVSAGLVRRQTTPTPVPAGGRRSSGRRSASVKPSLRGTPALATLSSSCTISTRSTPGSRKACSTSAADAAVARPRRAYSRRTQ